MSGKRRTKAAEPRLLEVGGVPTAVGLANMGREYAYAAPKGIHITDRGHALLGEKLREKGRQAREGEQ